VNIGQTVWYALSLNQARKVNAWRCKPILGEDRQGETPNVIVHLGEPVSDTMLLPAEVVACYTVEEALLRLRPDDADNLYDAEDLRQPHITFSGFADIRVKLPGNDTLWLPWTQQDRQCKAVQGRGHGTTSMPREGLFTTSAPAELL
jgi:hypothetical protein